MGQSIGLCLRLVTLPPDRYLTQVYIKFCDQVLTFFI